MNKNQFFLMDDNAINELVKRITDKLNLSLGKDPLQEDEFMTIDELAKFISMTKGSIYGLVHKNDIPYHKKGKLYFLKSEIMDWIKSGKRETKSTLHEKADEYLLKNPFN
ncbi:MULTISPECIES: helix-turn-helix transcriptional regulator [unclassified Olleya]|jgi:excisionase family DNA binding protein|uniref:helix-turn-helix transcriptional regulator n=1 Tax=unclassified Olleya TaxID=2615019 RepID=UPI0011AA5643|nr:helix-turn-helix domain-containing protein [Olleya sp. Hel_I_94]TVZ46145.1 AlpA family transcriptional regulator [Olleya sp. Hel_I_94]